MAISHMVTGRCCHHPAISIYLALSQTCSPDRLELHLSGLGGLGLGLGLDLGLGPGPERPVTLCSCRRGGGLTDRERNRRLLLPTAGTRMRAGKLAFPLKSKTRFALPVQRRANTSKVAVSQRRMTLSASPGLALAATLAPLLRPAAILQMAIKMHEVCWRGAQPLNWQKQNLRGRNKQVERATELIPRGAPRALQTRRQRLLCCVSEKGGSASCYLCYQLNIRRGAALLQLQFDSHELRCAAA